MKGDEVVSGAGSPASRREGTVGWRRTETSRAGGRTPSPGLNSLDRRSRSERRGRKPMATGRGGPSFHRHSTLQVQSRTRPEFSVPSAARIIPAGRAMGDLTREQKIEIYRFMRLNRGAEDRLVNLYRQDKVV